MAEPIVYEDPYSAEERLRSLGLRMEILIDVLRQGELQRRMASPLDPPCAPGFAGWSRKVRALREWLLPEWHQSDRDNFSTVISPDGMVAVAIATGDDDTGDPSDEARPHTKYARGPATVRAVSRNEQLEMFPETIPSDVLGEATATWFLLSQVEGDTIYAELSRPLQLGDDRRVGKWAERIIVGPIELDGDAGSMALPPDEPIEAPDVTVERKLN